MKTRPTKTRAALRAAALLIVLALTAISCSGGDGDPVEASDGLGDTGQPTTAPVATTAPLDVETADPDATLTTPEMPTRAPERSSEYENIVLIAKDNVGEVPTFDGPNGNQITLYDVNALDNGKKTPYPLIAETFYGNRLALLVAEYDESGAWAKVYPPVRPNGTTVWVQTAWFEEQRNDYHITIDISDAEVTVYKAGEPIKSQVAVLGRDTRPTPALSTYIDEKIAGSEVSAAYGTWILSLAAFSESLPYFDASMPKLALHGTNQPDIMGQYVSSGCVRVPNDVIEFIEQTVPVGTVVDIIP